ncbi:hypothetical protein F4604DRAFT_1795551 [Suillus subluteus]|nr:hypothetical protein F4604DRAFT_1795551 [Suillus subluteus]
MRFILVVIAALASSISAMPADVTGARKCPACSSDADCMYSLGCGDMWVCVSISSFLHVSRVSAFISLQYDRWHGYVS